MDFKINEIMEAKTASASYTTMNELVLPNDTNTYGDLMGGRLMYWMDIAAYLSAAKHCNSGAMTASVDNISFKTPIKLGNVICIEAKVTRAFTTSMEIHLKVWNQNTIEQTRVLSNEAYFTFVALDAQKQPKKVPAIIAETDEEKKYFASALRRRQLRLILAGKMKPDDATELKALFVKEEGE
jgi:acyl-CoA hydrolase